MTLQGMVRKLDFKILKMSQSGSKIECKNGGFLQSQPHIATRSLTWTILWSINDQSSSYIPVPVRYLM